MNKIHGETRIVLRNPISGNIIKDITSENTFQTSVMQQAVRTIGPAGDCPYLNDVVRSQLYWKNLVGGIFLFRDSINIGDLYMSAGNKMIGNGSFGITNGEAPNELGSYNAQESSESSSAITQVYDFSTNQANGQISCVCLTSQTGGYIGYGNPSGQKKANLYPYSRNQTTYTPNPFWTQDYIQYNGVNYYYNNKAKRIVCGNKEYFIALADSNKKIVIHEWGIPITKGSIFDGFKKETVIDVSNMPHYSTFTGNSIWLSLDEGNVYITNTFTNLLSGATTYYYKIDLSNYSVTEHSFINSLPSTISGVMTICCGVITVAGGRTAYFFDQTSGAHLKTFDYGVNAEQMMVGNMGNGLIRISNLTGSVCDVIYDRINDTVYPNNGYIPYNYEYVPLTYDTFSNSLVHGSRYSTYMYSNPLYLATINNLNSPVTKTAAQTMKVTYTLTEA